MKADRKSRGVAPLFLNLGTRWRSVVNFTPQPLCRRKEPRYPLSGGLGGSVLIGEEKNLLPLPAFEPRTVQPVAQSLYRPRFIVSHRAYL